MAFKRNGPPPPKHSNGWHAYDAKGRILRLSSGLVVVPFEWNGATWNAVVVEGDETYPRGGYNIVVFNEDMLAAQELRAVPGE